MIELPGIEAWCTVLIGSGEGTIDPELAVLSWAHGLADAVREAGPAVGWTLGKLVVAEIYLGRAESVARAFESAASHPAIAQVIDLRSSTLPVARSRAAVVG